MIEALEPRTLLSLVTINGTVGADTIQMDIVGGNTVVLLNGAQVYNSFNQADFVINALDNNDTITISKVASGNSVDINAGSGNDAIHVSDARLSDIQGAVDVLGEDGNDSLTVSDQQDVSPAPFYIDNTGAGFFNGNKHLITVEDDVESQVYQFSNNADTIELGSTEVGMQILTGGGDDTVNLGGGDQIIPDAFAPATIDGQTGNDRIFADDSGRSLNVGRSYDITPTGALNMTIANCERFDLDAARLPNDSQNNHIEITGNPGFGAISLHDYIDTDLQHAGEQFSSHCTLHIGTASTPVDLDSMNVTITLNVDLNRYPNDPGIQINDEDSDGSDNPWLFYSTTIASGTQWTIAKGSTTILIPQFIDGVRFGTAGAYVNGGSTDDLFEIASVPAFNYLSINGGGGSDSNISVNYGSNQSAGDLSAVLSGGFFFAGGAGTDFLDLNDTTAPIGNGDSSYALVRFGIPFDKYLLEKNGASLLDFDAFDVEQVNFVADAGSNAITFDDVTSVQMTLNGGAGSDLFTNSGSAKSLGGPVHIIGGPGTDTLAVQDNLLPGGSSLYGLNASEFWFDTPTPQSSAYFYDSTLENFSLDESDIDSTTMINGKPAALHVTVNGQGGNDSFVVGGGDLDSNGFTNITLTGGTGIDPIEFDDHSDQAGGGETDAYAVNNQEISKGSGADIIYATFDSQQVDASTNGSGAVFSGNVVNLNAATMPTTITGGAGRACTINVASGDLSSIAAPVTLVMGIAGGANINDQASTGDKTYVLSPGLLTTVPSATTVAFSGAGITLNANVGNNTVVVLGAAAGAPLIINAGDGNDSIGPGGGDIDQNLLSTVSVNGGTGTDTVGFDNTIDATFESETLSGATFTDGLTHSFSNVELVQIFTGPGGGVVNLNNVAVVTLVNGGSGNDAVNIGAGDLDSNLLANVTVLGNAGTDTMLVNDSSPSAGGIYTYNVGTFRKGNLGKTVFVTGIEGDTLQTSRGDDAVTITGVTYPLEVLSGTGNDTVTANASSDVSFNTGAETVEGFGSFGDTISVNPAGSGAAVMTVFHSDSVASVSTAVGGKLVVESGDVLTNTHDLTNTGAIDLSGGALIVNGAASQVTQYQTWLKAGYASGAWNGTSITINKVATPGAINSALAAQDHTHFAVGFAPASAIFGTFPATFVGQSVASTAMLVRYTTVGDANLDGKTNALDFNALATNFGSTTANWYQGDFNYDGKANTTDFNALALNFNANLASAAPLAAVETSTAPDSTASKTDLFGKKIIGENDVHDLLEVTSLTL